MMIVNHITIEDQHEVEYCVVGVYHDFLFQAAANTIQVTSPDKEII